MKSLYTKLSEAIDKMTKVQRDKFYESKPKGSAIEPILNCAEQILAGKVKEAAPVVRKHNGAGDNGELLTEGANSWYSEQSADPREAQVRNYMLTCKITEAEARRVLNLPPKAVAEKGRKACADYAFAKSIGMSEVNALAFASR
jgi:hypothetical protein